MTIQRVFPDDVGKAGSRLIAGVCADAFPYGVGQSLAGAALYVEVYLHLIRQMGCLGIRLGVDNGVSDCFYRFQLGFLVLRFRGLLRRSGGVLGGFLRRLHRSPSDPNCL